MKLYNLLLVFIFFTFLNSCDLDTLFHFSANLTHGYKIAEIKTNENDILGTNYIDPNIVTYGFDSDFILAEQIPDRFYFICGLSYDMRERYNAYCNVLKGNSFSFIIADSIARNLDIKNYIGKQWNYKLIDDSTIYKYFTSKHDSFNYTSHDNIADSLSDSLISNHPIYKKYFQASIFIGLLLVKTIN